MTERSLQLDDRRVRGMLKGVNLAATRPKRAWDQTAQYMRVRTDSMFPRLRRGGSHRGVRWEPWAPQYVRKDGTVVPAWGGIPKLRGRGNVKGRLRPSGKRVTASSALMQDTKTLRGRAALVVRQTNVKMTMGPQGTRYAAAQNRRRPFLFFEIPKDAGAIGKIFARHIAKRAKEGANSAGGINSALSFRGF